MISFDEIDNRLKRLGKDRAWLAEATGYKPAYIRDVLAPKSTRRTERAIRMLSDAIEREEARQAAPAPSAGPLYTEVFLTNEELAIADRASRIVGAPTLAEFCRSVIQNEARKIIARNQQGREDARKTHPPLAS